MKVCILTTEFVTEHYFSGGLAQHFFRIARWLVEQGHKVSVITMSDKDEKIDFEGIEVYRVSPGEGLFLRLAKIVTLNRIVGIIDSINYSYSAYKKVKAINKKESIDIVHAPNTHACGYFALKMLKIPHIVIVSCYRPFWNELAGVRRGIDRYFDECIEKFYYRSAKYIYAPSFNLKRILAREIGVQNVDIIRTPFYLEVPELDDSVYTEKFDSKDYILFYGRLQIHKGVHIIARALPDLLSGLPEMYAGFVGSDASSKFGGSMKKYILKQAGKYSERVIFHDAVRHDKLYPIIKKARLVVLPSLIDNLPNTLLEAMGLGKVVIGTTGASFDEVIEDGKTGFLVPIGDPKALEQKIKNVWNREDLDKIGSAASEKIREFAPERTVGDLIDYYKKISRKEKSSGRPQDS